MRRKGEKGAGRQRGKEESGEKTLPLPSLQSLTDPFPLPTEAAVTPQSGSVCCKDTLAGSGGAVDQAQTVPLPSLHSEP